MRKFQPKCRCHIQARFSGKFKPFQFFITQCSRSGFFPDLDQNFFPKSGSGSAKNPDPIWKSPDPWKKHPKIKVQVEIFKLHI